ncbi:MAG: ATP synthase F0 subunit B [Ruminococcaceae bacterium]|nr:ATP synthase F0 subunit B [Oscillospiraceae bacterium]
MPLNIDWQQILLHLFNFVLLFGIAYFLLYKPVKKFMDDRTAYYKEMDDRAKANLEESEKVKEEYQAKLANVEDEIIEEKRQAYVEIEKLTADKLGEAIAEADKIIANAHKTSEAEHDKMIKAAKIEITDMVTSAAEKLVSEKSTSGSFDEFLEKAEKGDVNE